jgi:1-aminocyclopropane-1-carboxylate deaminase/D-cysteine desulfhydrase-like pyridoxal-dependent ACC family enzyme
MYSRGILRLLRNANPENANRYTQLRWAKVFSEQADRLLTEVVECMGLKLDMVYNTLAAYTHIHFLSSKLVLDRRSTRDGGKS